MNEQMTVDDPPPPLASPLLDHPDPINEPNQELRDLIGGPLQIELRGFEVARHTGSGWEQVMHYRPTDRGRRQALTDARWLTRRANERKDRQVYSVRPIVSLEPPAPKTEMVPEPVVPVPRDLFDTPANPYDDQEQLELPLENA